MIEMLSMMSGMARRKRGSGLNCAADGCLQQLHQRLDMVECDYRMYQV